MDQNKIPHDPHHLRVSSGASKMISEVVVRSAQTVHLSYIKVSTISNQTEVIIHYSMVTLKYHRLRPKGFSEPRVRMAQSM
jgi:hypothetical protein